jgi:hypothetical protein
MSIWVWVVALLLGAAAARLQGWAAGLGLMAIALLIAYVIA